jgi:lysine-N-methylase
MTTAAMESFSCLAETCPDTCCRDWAVPIDRSDLDRMKTAMSSSPEGRDRLVRLVVIGRPARGTDALAQIHLDDSGACPMLEADQRCGVHATVGEEALTTACSVFPRTALAVADHVEVGGSLGCPEVARLTLLSDGPLSLKVATRPMLPRPYVGKTIARDPGDAYAGYFSEVRATLQRCFQQSWKLSTQLALAADFADRVQSFFHAGTAEFEGAGRPFAERRLRAERDATAVAALPAALETDLAALQVSGAPVMGVLVGFLLDRKRLPHSQRFAALLAQVFAPVTTGAPGAPGEAAAAVAPTLGELLQRYVQRRDALQLRAGAVEAQIFGNYCQHFLMRNPYTDAPTLLDYLYRLGIHLAAVRLLTTLHPDVEAMLSRAPDRRSDAEVLNRAAIHAVQTFTKAIGHHPEYLDAALRGSGTITFGRLVLLAKFV